MTRSCPREWVFWWILVPWLPRMRERELESKGPLTRARPSHAPTEKSPHSNDKFRFMHTPQVLADGVLRFAVFFHWQNLRFVARLIRIVSAFSASLARSSRGPGHQILILKIRGSNPLRATKIKNSFHLEKVEAVFLSVAKTNSKTNGGFTKYRSASTCKLKLLSLPDVRYVFSAPYEGEDSSLSLAGRFQHQQRSRNLLVILRIRHGGPR